MITIVERTLERKVVFVTAEKRDKPTLTNIIYQYVKNNLVFMPMY